MLDGRIPTHIRIEAALKHLNQKGVFYYIPHTGDKTSGSILLHFSLPSHQNCLLMEQRDISGKLRWVKLHQEDTINDSDAQAVILKQKSFDEDLWVIEIEDILMNNPFEL